MARTTTAQFARQLRRLGATVTVHDDREVIARYGGVEVTARFDRELDVFTVAWRSGDPTQNDADVAWIRSMAGVRRALALPKQPVLAIGRTGRRTSRTHILRNGWYSTAECGVGLLSPFIDGAPSDVTCARCKSLWRQR